MRIAPELSAADLQMSNLHRVMAIRSSATAGRWCVGCGTGSRTRALRHADDYIVKDYRDREREDLSGVQA